MTNIPNEVLDSLKQFSKDLVEIEKTVAEFVAMTPEQRKALTPLERARRDVTAASVVNNLYCMHASTLGHDPNREDMVGVEQRKIAEVDDRLDELERRPFRPALNKRVASSFIRNALYETPSGDDQTDDAQGAQTGLYVPDDENNEEYDEEEAVDEEDNYELEDNF